MALTVASNPSNSFDLNSKLNGIYTAIVTPFVEEGKSIDYASIDGLIQRQIEAGVTGLVIAGSTGEAATLSEVEYSALIRYIVDRAEGKLVCFAGVNSSSTAKAVELACRASDSGADGLLVVTPPYNKPTQAGIIRHFEEIQQATRKPILAYNIPGRAVSFMTPQTIATLANQGLIVGLKESSGSIDTCLDFFAATPKNFPIFCGDDSLSLSILCHGGVGVVSVASNIAPRSMVRLCDIVAKCNFVNQDSKTGVSQSLVLSDLAQARQLQFELLTLIRALYLETNPIAVKAAMKICGLIKESSLRLPLTSALDATVERLEKLFSDRAFE